LALWKESVTQCNGVETSVGGETALGRGKGGDDASWADTDLTELKKKKIHAVDSAVINNGW
jgi:hypothetical protein